MHVYVCAYIYIYAQSESVLLCWVYITNFEWRMIFFSIANLWQVTDSGQFIANVMVCKQLKIFTGFMPDTHFTFTDSYFLCYGPHKGFYTHFASLIWTDLLLTVMCERFCGIHQFSCTLYLIFSSNKKGHTQINISPQWENTLVFLKKSPKWIWGLNMIKKFI